MKQWMNLSIKISMVLICALLVHGVTHAEPVIYGANAYGSSDMVRIDLSLQTGEAVGQAAFETQAIDQDPETGFVYYYEWQITGDELAYWDPATGTNVIVRQYNPSPGIYVKQMAFSPEGILYGITNEDKIYAIDKNNGDITFVAQITGLEAGPYERTGDMTFTPDGTLYILTYESLYVVDRQTYVATLLYTDMLVGSGIMVWTGAAFCDGLIYGSDGDTNSPYSSIYSIDPETGETIKLFSSGNALNDLSSCSVMDINANHAPVLDPLGDQYLTEGDALGFVVSGTDVDEDLLTFSAEGIPQGATFNPETGEFAWVTQSGDAGEYVVVFTATDDGDPSKTDTEQVRITVAALNEPVSLTITGDDVVEDAMIAGGTYQLNNFGGAVNYLEVGSYGLPVRSLIRWDLSMIPQGSTIIKAEMALNCYWDYTGGEITINAHQVLKEWVEGSLADQNRTLDNPDSTCWEEYGYGQPWAQPGADGATDRKTEYLASVSGSGTGWYVWDVLPAAQGWIDGSEANNGIILIAESGTTNNLKIFAPTEYSNKSLIPKLTIEYLPPSNQPPVLDPIGNQSVAEGDALVFTVSASDLDGDEVFISVQNLPDGAGFNSVTGEFSWTPSLDQAGTYESILFTATDDGTPNLTDSESISITVRNVNRAPVLTAINDQSVAEGDALTFTVSASDPDSDAVFLSAENLPEGAYFNSATGEFSWTPSFDQAGVYENILFTATDDGTPNLTDSESITITAGNVNRAPALSAIGDQSVEEGSTLAFTISASDIDGDGVFLSAQNLPGGANFNSATGEFTWTPELGQSGIYENVLFTATDDGTPNLTDSESITITVGNVNRAPVLSAIGDQLVDEGNTLAFTVSASDPDGDAVTLSVQNLPEGANFNSATGGFSWTPESGQAGIYENILFTTTDDGTPNLTDSESITITVGNVNRAPVLTAIGDKYVMEGEPLVFFINASDPDGDALIYYAEELPPGAAFDTQTGKFSWATQPGDAGEYPVSFSVSDDGIPSESDTEQIRITVTSLVEPVSLTITGDDFVEDAMIAGGGYTYSNFGGAVNYLEVGSYGLPVRSLIRWDLSMIPDGSTIIKAEMALNCYWDYTGGEITINAHQVLKEWVEGSLADQNRTLDNPDSTCWEEYGYGQPWAQPGADGATDRETEYLASVSGSGTGWYVWDILPAAQGWIDGSEANNGIILIAESGTTNNLKIFAPTEYSNKSLIPKLTIEYLPPSNQPPVLDSIGNQSVDEGDALVLTVSASDPDGGVVFLSVENLPEGANFNSATGEFTWTPAFDQSGTYANILFTATDDGTPNLTDSESIAITVGNVNRAPVLTAIGDQSVDEGNTLAFTVSATDPDGNGVVLSVQNLPEGANFNSATGGFTWTPSFDQSGTYENILFTATDDGTPNLADSESIAITVGDVNRAPVLAAIGDQSVDEGNTLAFTVSATDPDGNGVVLSVQNLPEGANFNSATGEFTWTPSFDQSGTYENILFTATDDGTPNLADSESITITVGDVNRAPVLTAIGDQSVDEGNTLAFTVSATDPDGNGVVLSVQNLPEGADFNSATGEFTWTPEPGQSGIHENVLFTATDDGTPNLADSESITITVGDVNRAPVLTAIGDQSVDEGNTLAFTVSATDPDGNGVVLSVQNLPEGADFNSATGGFTWTPSFDQSGTYENILFRATDDGTPNLTDSESITITVGNVNRAPVLTATGDQSVDEGNALAFTVSATDPDGNGVVLSVQNLPEGADFNSATGGFTWTPSFDQSGTYENILFRATDDGTPNLTDSESITITVGDVNRAPVLTAIDNQSVDEGNALAFTVSATDPDGNGVVLSVQNLPEGANFNSATGGFTWTPSFDQSGTYENILFRATDDGTPNLTDSEGITITVGNVNRAPVLTAIGDQSVDEGNALAFTVSATDPDGNGVVLSVQNLPEGANFNSATGGFTWTPSFDQSGTYENILFRATDDGTPNLTDSESITITVGNVNRAPVLTAIGDQSVDEGNTLAFTVSATDPDGNGVVLSVQNLPEGANFNSATGEFTWTPEPGQSGIHENVLFTATDDGTPNLTDSEGITIAVNPNDPPSPVALTLSGPGVTQDTMIISGAYSQLNFGGSPDRLGTGYFGVLGRSLIRWDLSSIPHGSTIVSAVMSVYAVQDPTGGQTTVHAHKVLREWTEGSLNGLNRQIDNPDSACWVEAGAGIKWQTAGATGVADSAPEIAAATTGTGVGWYDLDITDTVSQWVLGTQTNFGLLLRTGQEASYNAKVFAASEHSDESLRPYLIIEYLPAQ